MVGSGAIGREEPRPEHSGVGDGLVIGTPTGGSNTSSTGEVAPTTLTEATTAAFASLDELLWRISWEARPKYRGRLHALSAFLAPPAALAVIAHARPGRVRAATAVYGAGLCALFAVSGSYHRLTRSRRAAAILRELDHSTIYVMIAGTWTPIVVAVLPPRLARIVLAAVWGSAAVAIGAKVTMLDQDRAAGSWFYPVLGVAGAALAPPIAASAGIGAVGTLAAGGAAFLGGAAVFAARRPNPWPRTFGFHEIFHAAVVAGVAAHYSVIWRLVGRSVGRRRRD